MGEGRTEKERKDKQTRAQPGWLGEMEERGGMLLDGMGEEEREEHDFVFPAQKAAERCCDWDRNGNGNGGGYGLDATGHGHSGVGRPSAPNSPILLRLSRGIPRLSPQRPRTLPPERCRDPGAGLAPRAENVGTDLDPIGADVGGARCAS